MHGLAESDGQRLGKVQLGAANKIEGGTRMKTFITSLFGVRLDGRRMWMEVRGFLLQDVSAQLTKRRKGFELVSARRVVNEEGAHLLLHRLATSHFKSRGAKKPSTV